MRSCVWTGVVSLECNPEMQSVLLGCLFILVFIVVLTSKHEYSLTILFDKEEKHNFLLCSKKWPCQDE